MRFSVHFTFALIKNRSDDDGRLQVVRLFGSVMFHLRPFILPEKIKPKAVFLQVYDVKQGELQLFALRWVDFALKDRVLHTLSICAAFPRNLPQAPPPFDIDSFDIVGNQNIHDIPLLLP
jgi:hypothetical protein